MYKPLENFLAAQTWLDRLAAPLQDWINGVFSSDGMLGKDAKNLLNGTWLGHPLHPAITDIPVGAWVCTSVLDAVATASDSDDLRRAADITLVTGLLASIGAASTGWTDWSDTYGQDRKLGLLHGLTMVTAVLTYAASLAARLSGARRTGTILANSGLAIAAAGSYLGGDEVYDLGYGVNHTAYHSGPSDFLAVLPESSLEPDTPTQVDAEGRSVVLVKHDGQVFALDDTCVHAGCSLAGGSIEGRSIVCPCHGSQFDLKDGSVLNGPATRPEPTMTVRLRDGQVEVKG